MVDLNYQKHRTESDLIKMNGSLSINFTGGWSRLLGGIYGPFERLRKRKGQNSFHYKFLNNFPITLMKWVNASKESIFVKA